ncbi:MAG: type ISP restriction/modification enzyme [Flavisolibacter sp.]
MTIEQYIDTINKRYRQGNTTEHSFRGDLLHLLETLMPGASITNEPKRQTCGAPDYIVSKKEIPLGFIEAKDIGDADLDGTKKTGNKEQFDRYKASLSNIIFTDYLDFHLYHDGVFVTKIAIAELQKGSIVPLKDNFTAFANLVKDFAQKHGQTIKSSKRLAELMAAKARLLADVIEKALNSDEDRQENSTLKDQMTAFKEILIHDISPKSFADVYAQTIAYGLFAARLHDPTLPTFSRAEAAELIPKSNPFLRKLFGYIAGPDIDDRIKWIVDSLIEVFLACNVEELLKNYGKSTKTEDPIIHFYETFLSEYDPRLRKARGVWYTPHPVVNFIVRAVDDILKTEFGLREGLADTSKTKIKVQLPETDKRYKDNVKTVEEEVHRVQILDPATGTGTFLAEVVKQVHKRFEGQQGIWSNYVDTHLLPRLNGFELLMASYAMAHLQLDLLLKETGYKPTKDQRFKVYLTNSLEEYHKDTGTLFANWLSTEANEANRIKRDTPVMCVIGNPPYSVSSTNKGEWIENLVEDYKKNLNERNIQPLSDDYIKFIRFGQFLVERNGSGILAYITNNSFIDGLIHKQMRKHLLETFDRIYILDLHGSTKRKEVTKDGSKDENVFDIQPGVSINIFIKKNGQKKSLAQLFKYDLHGKREFKYQFLNENDLRKIPWNKLDQFDKQFSFKEFTESSLSDENSFSVNNLFHSFASGITTERDDLTIQFEKEILDKIANDFSHLTEAELRKEYNLGPDGRDWKIFTAKADILKKQHVLTKIRYRPFDDRYTLYSGKSKGFHSYPRSNVMSHFIDHDNYGLIIGRQGQAMGSGEWNIVFVSKTPVDSNIFYRGRGTVFPLYTFSENDNQQSIEQKPTRTPNLNPEIVNKISEALHLTFTPEKETEGEVCFANNPDLRPEFRTSFAPIDILDYIYAVLHSPTYREKYKEFLKIDFPRVPYPKDANTFWQLVKLGGELRQIHLLESPVVSRYITQYPFDGSNTVTKPKYENGKVYINDAQYFDNVPEVAWNFYIGGYQPAQKWLKDRKERQLSFEDILHYQQIIVALAETDRLMKEIDGIKIE